MPAECRGKCSKIISFEYRPIHECIGCIHIVRNLQLQQQKIDTCRLIPGSFHAHTRSSMILSLVQRHDVWHLSSFIASCCFAVVQKGPYNLAKATNVLCRNWRWAHFQAENSEGHLIISTYTAFTRSPSSRADPPLGSDSARGLSSSAFTLPQLADQTRLAFSSPVKFGRYPQCSASHYGASSFICHAFPRAQLSALLWAL